MFSHCKLLWPTNELTKLLIIRSQSYNRHFKRSIVRRYTIIQLELILILSYIDMFWNDLNNSVWNINLLYMWTIYSALFGNTISWYCVVIPPPQWCYWGKKTYSPEQAKDLMWTIASGHRSLLGFLINVAKLHTILHMIKFAYS